MSGLALLLTSQTECAENQAAQISVPHLHTYWASLTSCSSDTVLWRSHDQNLPMAKLYKYSHQVCINIAEIIDESQLYENMYKYSHMIYIHILKIII
jgi:hypothetical protein